MNSALGSYEKFLPGFRDEERSKILGTSSGTKLENKVNMAKYKNFNFRAYHSFGNSKICNTAFKWDAYDVENTAGNARRCHPDRQNSMILPFRMMKCLYGQNFQPAYRDFGLKNRASPPSHMNTSKCYK